MNPTRSVLALAALALVSALPLAAQAPSPAFPTPRPRTSPHEVISSVIDGSRVTLIYGRPYSKDPKTGDIRKIWGGLVKYGKVERAGSDEATTLITQQPLDFSGTAVPAGAYTLYLLTAADGSAKLIINKQLGQWGINGDQSTTRDEKFDLAQVNLTKEALDPRMDQYTMAIVKGVSGGGVIMLGWENTKYSAPFTVKK